MLIDAVVRADPVLEPSILQKTTESLNLTIFKHPPQIFYSQPR